MKNWTAVLPATVLLLIVGGWGGRQLMSRRAEASIAQHQAEVTTLMACSVYHPPPPLTPHPWGEDNFWDLVHPALDALWTLQADVADSEEFAEDGPDDRKISQKTAAVLNEAALHFEACRQALKRSVRNWKGSPDEQLLSKGRLTVQHLCFRSLLAWQEGRDAEAVDWIITALTVAQETTRFDAYPSENMLRLGEQWAYQACRRLLSKHGLSAIQLDDFGQRLARLMQSRPRSPRQLHWFVGATREVVLQRPGQLGLDVLHADGRDLWSPPIKVERILTGLRDAEEQVKTLPCSSSVELQSQWTALGMRSGRRDVERIWLNEAWYWQELEAYLRLDLLRIAVGVARFEAEKDRMPATLSEAGLEGIAVRPVTIEGHQLVVQMLLAGETYSRLSSGVDPVKREWEIRRR